LLPPRLRLILRSRAKRGVSKDEGGRGGRLMVRDARLRRAPSHEAGRGWCPAHL